MTKIYYLCQYRKEFKTEYKKRFRPFSQYEYTEGRFMKRKEGDVIDTAVPDIPLTVPLRDLSLQSGDSWYHEVLELRKKAGEYKVQSIFFATCFRLHASTNDSNKNMSK
jgi:hypothetical protein